MTARWLILCVVVFAQVAWAEDSQEADEEGPVQPPTGLETFTFPLKRPDPKPFDKPCSFYEAEARRSRVRVVALTLQFERSKTDANLNRLHAERDRLSTADDQARLCEQAAQPSAAAVEEAAKKPAARAFMWSARICVVKQRLAWQSRRLTRMRHQGYIGMDSEERLEQRYRQAITDAVALTRRERITLRSCSERAVQQMWHCLESLYQNGEAIGSPYGGPHCDLMPYSAARVADQLAPPMKLDE